MDSVVIKNQAALGKPSPLPQPLMALKTAEDEESIQDKAHRMWHVLRGAVNDSSEKIRRSDWKPLDLENGIQHVQRVIFKKAIHHVLFNVNTKEYICMVSKTGVCIYHCDGRKKREFTLREPLEGLVYAQQINRYVAWNTCPQLKVLDSDFQTISTNRSKQTITCCLYNEDLSEIVTAGIGNICSWHFYFGYRDLMCASTISKGLTEHDVFTELALERAPVLASTLPRTQRCYAVCGMGVAVFDLPKATLISYEKALHNRKITGITLFETLRCVVTSSRDGNIKIWDENWNLQMVFVGHRGPVTALAIYPHGPYLLSASEDETIRIWSLVMGDQVNEIQMGVAVTRLGTELGEDSIFSYANQRLDLWTIVHLYNQHTTIGYTVRAIKSGNVGMVSHFPMRAVCSCADGAARLVSSDTGDVIATFLLERGQQVVDLDYCLVREALLVLSDEGDIVKANALTNPMETMWKVPGSSQASQLCCFCIFTHVANMELTHSRWLQAVAGGSERKIKIVGVKDHDRFLLIAGHLNGFLSVLDWNSGITQYQVQAHESRVLTLVADPENQHLLSSGEDNTIKVWRVFPYAQESLSLLMNFYSAHCSTHLCVLKTMFVVALQNPMCAVHTIVLCDLWKKIRRDHHPTNDHEDEIIGLCACPELKIFASTSRGGTLKIWDHNNQLLRIIHLKAVVNSISFCNDVGDLLLGIERNLYHMNSKEYLTQPYLLRIACRDASDPVPDVPVPISSTALDSLSAEDRQRLRGPHSFKHSPKHPVVEPDELDEDSMKKQEQLREAYALLAARDEEILLIQRGELKSKAKPPRTKEICEEGFRKYMQLFYVKTPKIEICEDELYDPGEKLIKPKSLFEGPYKCIPISRGFFPPLALPKPWELVSDKEKMARGLPSWARTPFIPIALDGFIPNSVFLRLFWPLEPWEILESESVSQAESKLELKVEMKTESKEELRPSKEMQPLATSTKRSSIFLEKLEAVMEEERRKMEEQAESNVDVPVPVPVEEKERKFSTAAMRNSLIIRRRSTLVKDVPTPPTVPRVVALFQGYAWFEKLFPNADASNFPPDLSEKAFVEMLIMLLATADYDVKEGIAKAFVVLLASQRSNITKLACDALIAALNGPNPPRQEVREQEDFIRVALWALKELMPDAQNVLIELMVQFLQSNIILRNTIKLLLTDMGLLDPHNYFETEMNSWTVSEAGSGSTKEKLRYLSSVWLKKWTRKFKQHVQTAMQSLKKGQTLKGSIPVPRSASAGKRSPRDMFNSTDNKITSMKIPADRQLGSLAQLRPIEAVNYFCEMQLQQQLTEMMEAQKQGDTMKTRRHSKNTVLFLPKVQRQRAILRLGETSTSVTETQMEKFHLPPITSGSLSFDIGRFIKLSIPKVNLNPFPSPIDHYPLQHVLVTLQHSPQKYFILERSYVSNYN